VKAAETKMANQRADKISRLERDQRADVATARPEDERNGGGFVALGVGWMALMVVRQPG
jgi:hypothetical protein